jgi:hypothetical protein
MSYLFTALLVLIPLLIAVWAHTLLPRIARKPRDIWITRLLLLGVGTAFGMAMAFYYFDVAGVQRLLVFLGSFGIVHVPAAAILFLKQRQRR